MRTCHAADPVDPKGAWLGGKAPMSSATCPVPHVQCRQDDNIHVAISRRSRISNPPGKGKRPECLTRGGCSGSRRHHDASPSSRGLGSTQLPASKRPQDQGNSCQADAELARSEAHRPIGTRQRTAYALTLYARTASVKRNHHGALKFPQRRCPMTDTDNASDNITTMTGRDGRIDLEAKIDQLSHLVEHGHTYRS